MALFRRKKKDINLGNVSIGSSDTPTKVDENDAAVREKRRRIAKDTEKKIQEYRKDNPEKPEEGKNTQIDAPLKIRRAIGSLDGEYVEIAKRYLGLPDGSKPTVVELSKAVIKLFEDNAKLYKELAKLKGGASTAIRTSQKHSWEQGSSWN